jgi:hypothetical protein
MHFRGKKMAEKTEADAASCKINQTFSSKSGIEW